MKKISNIQCVQDLFQNTIGWFKSQYITSVFKEYKSETEKIFKEFSKISDWKLGTSEKNPCLEIIIEHKLFNNNYPDIFIFQVTPYWNHKILENPVISDAYFRFRFGCRDGWFAETHITNQELIGLNIPKDTLKDFYKVCIEELKNRKNNYDSRDELNSSIIEESEETFLDEDLMVFPQELNQVLFDGDVLRPEIRDKMIEIGQLFYDTFDLEFTLKDIYFEGSMAQYNWVDLKNINGIEGLNYRSDIDLHLVIDYNDIDIDKDVLSDYFVSKKTVFNEYHNITIKGFDVELGCVDFNTPSASEGVYSLYKDKWIKKPEPVSKEVENIRDTEDYAEMRNYVLKTVNSHNYSKAKDLWDKVKYMRRKSLALDGEFGKGNLIFKALRQEQLLDLLWTFIHNEEDKKLSLEESKSYDTNMFNSRYKEITNPQNIDYDNIEDIEKLDDDEYFKIMDIKAREEQINEIKNGKQFVKSDGSIEVIFNGGNIDIGFKAFIYPCIIREDAGKWEIDISGKNLDGDWLEAMNGGFYSEYTTQDMINIFGIKPNILKQSAALYDKDNELKNQLNDLNKMWHKEDIIEESIKEHYSIQEKILNKFKEKFNVNNPGILAFDNDTKDFLIQCLYEYFDKDIVDLYLRRKGDNIYYHNISTIIKQIIFLLDIKEHKEEYFNEKSQDITFDYFDQEPCIYRVGNDNLLNLYIHTNYDIKISAKEAVQVLNVKSENIYKLFNRPIIVDREYKDVIEESEEKEI